LRFSVNVNGNFIAVGAGGVLAPAQECLQGPPQSVVRIGEHFGSTTRQLVTLAVAGRVAHVKLK